MFVMVSKAFFRAFSCFTTVKAFWTDRKRFICLRKFYIVLYRGAGVLQKMTSLELQLIFETHMQPIWSRKILDIAVNEGCVIPDSLAYTMFSQIVVLYDYTFNDTLEFSFLVFLFSAVYIRPSILLILSITFHSESLPPIWHVAFHYFC